nr:hypothetical protein [Kibdelosporangium sp. MJ126-NF4]
MSSVPPEARLTHALSSRRATVAATANAATGAHWMRTI